jgi:hypothetical protein
MNHSELNSVNTDYSSVVYVHGKFYENADGMLVPITASTAQAIWAAVHLEENEPSREGTAI